MRARDIVGAPPGAVCLIGRLLSDRRVPGRARAAAGIAAAHVALPIDVVPDGIRFVGRADDALVLAPAMHVLVEAAGDDVVAEHRGGSGETLEAVRRGLTAAARRVPGRIRRSVLLVARS
jgi:uncharacterized membrane protein YkvA (DUF1232 family)